MHCERDLKGLMIIDVISEELPALTNEINYLFK